MKAYHNNKNDFWQPKDKQLEEKMDKLHEKPTFELLMEKFQFHNSSVHFHAELAKRVGDVIRDEYPEEAKKTGYFTEEFFEARNSEIEEQNKADEERTSVSDEPQASDSAAVMH